MIDQQERRLTLNVRMTEPLVPVVLKTNDLGDGGTLDSVSVDSGYRQSSNGTMIFGLPWSEYVARPDAIDRYKIIADATKTNFQAADNLGFGVGTSPLTHEQAVEIRAGSFDSVTKSHWEIFNVADRDLSFVGYSLGAGVVASMLKTAPEDTHVNRVFLWEAISKKQPVLSLARNFAAENKTWSNYFPENPTWMNQPGVDPKMIHNILSHPSGYVSYPIGMAHGNLFDDLTVARERQVIDSQTEFILLNGSDSRVSPTKENMELAYRIHTELGIGAVRHEVLLGESHGMLDSSARVASALDPYF